MSWKDCAKEVCKQQAQPMHQITHWALFVGSGLIYMMKTVEGAAAASYELIIKNPEIASGSWLASGKK